MSQSPSCEAVEYCSTCVVGVGKDAAIRPSQSTFCPPPPPPEPPPPLEPPPPEPPPPPPEPASAGPLPVGPDPPSAVGAEDPEPPVPDDPIAVGPHRTVAIATAQMKTSPGNVARTDASARWIMTLIVSIRPRASSCR